MESLETAVKAYSRRMLVALVSCLLTLLPLTAAAQTSGPAKPRGIYVHVDLESVLDGVLESDGFTKAELSARPCSAVPESYQATVHSQLRAIYAGLVAQPDIAGIRAGINWCRVQTIDPYCVTGHVCPADHGNDWSFVDDFFEAARGAGKTVQLSMNGGIYSPSWLIHKLSDCTPVLESASPTTLPPCGRVTFSVYPEQRKAPDGVFEDLPMPLPWNSEYHSDWKQFLIDLAERYNASGPHFPRVLESIAIGGPICGSNEMILPTSLNGSYITIASVNQPADTVWKILIENGFKGNTTYAAAPGQVFVDEWNQAIDDYQNIFKGITLLLTPDDGSNFPELAITSLSGNTVYQQLSAAECYKNRTLSCQAKLSVLYNFIYSSTPPPAINIKSVEADGISTQSPAALSPRGIGLPGLKFLASYVPPVGAPPLAGALLDGGQFDYAVTKKKQREGCTSYPQKCPHLSVQQAAFNVFQIFFANTGTGATGLFDAVDDSPAYTVQYISVASSDVQYADTHSKQVPIANETDLSMQQILERASYALLYLIPSP